MSRERKFRYMYGYRVSRFRHGGAVTDRGALPQKQLRSRIAGLRLKIFVGSRFSRTVGGFCRRAFFAGLCLPFFALSLQESDLSPLYKILEEGEGGFYTLGKFQGEGGFPLRYGKFGTGRGANGSLVFLNGKGESLMKYIELFYDFSLLGWSPVYTYDHRGQGLSQSALPDSSVAVPEDYSLYREDLSAFMRFILNDREVSPSNIFGIAHSMGGTILLDYLRTRPTPFKAVALSAPMLKIQSNMPAIAERSLLSLLRGYCSLLPCAWKFPSLRNRFTQDALTNSPIRYAFSRHLIKTKFPAGKSRGTSVRWIIESFKVTEELMERNQARKISVPVLILQSERDFFVSNESQDSFCSAIPQCCRIEKIKGKHEIFLERDAPRNWAIEKTREFFLHSGELKKQCRP